MVSNIVSFTVTAESEEELEALMEHIYHTLMEYEGVDFLGADAILWKKAILREGH